MSRAGISMTGKRRRVQVGVVAELPLLFSAMDLSIMAAPASAAATAVYHQVEPETGVVNSGSGGFHSIVDSGFLEQIRPRYRIRNLL